MRLLQRTALGLDLTDGTLKAVLLGRRGRRVELLRAWRLPLQAEAEPEAALRGALRSFLRLARPGVLPRVVVSAPDRGHLGATYTVPAMEAERVDELVRYELLRGLAVPADELVLAHHVRKGVTESQVHGVALERGRSQRLTRMLTELSVPFDELAAPGWALASFLEHEQPLGRDRIVLGVGEQATTLVLLREDGLWSRHLPFGLSLAKSAEDLARRLHAETAAAISWFLPRDREFHPVDLVLTEEGALRGRLTTALKSAFDLPVSRISEFRRIDASRRKGGATPSAAEVLSMARAHGLALCGLGLARIHAPLPVDDDPRRPLLRRLPVAAASLAIAGVCLAGLSELVMGHAESLGQVLPVNLAADVRSSASRERVLLDEITRHEARLARLDELVGRSAAAYSVRKVTATLSEVFASRGDMPLHLTACWLTPGVAGRPGLLEFDLEAAPQFDDSLPTQLEAALQRASLQGQLQRVGPDPGNRLLVRWRLEVELP